MKEYNSKTYYSPSELEHMFPVSSTLIRSWLYHKKIEADLKIGDRNFFLKETIERLLKSK